MCAVLENVCERVSADSGSAAVGRAAAAEGVERTQSPWVEGTFPPSGLEECTDGI